MRIPNELEEKIEKEIKNISLTELRDTARILSDRYMNAKRTGQSLLNKNLEVLAYSIIRMIKIIKTTIISDISTN